MGRFLNFISRIIMSRLSLKTSIIWYRRKKPDEVIFIQENKRISGSAKESMLYLVKSSVTVVAKFLDGSSGIVEAVNQWSGDVSPEGIAPLNARIEQ